MDWWSVVDPWLDWWRRRCCAFRDRDRLARRDGWRRVIGSVVDRTKPVVLFVLSVPSACVCVGACVYACVRADQRHPRVWSFVFEINRKRYVGRLVGVGWGSTGGITIMTR